MHKAFADIKITEQQKKDAENLQKKVFLAFDEIDEMSQRYSEDVEAGTEIAKNAFSEVWTLGSAGAVAVGTIALFKGKLPISKIVNGIVNVGFKKDSGIRVAVNELYAALKQDKSLMHKFQKSLVEGNLGLFLQLEKAKPLKPAFEKLVSELSVFTRVSPSDTKAFKGILDSQLKQGIFAKWVRNLSLQSAAAYISKKTKMPLGSISDYKTLIGTGIVAGGPILGVMFAVPYALNAWLTDIQKKAGKIGIMKAMEKIDDPKIFVDQSVANSAA